MPVFSHVVLETRSAAAGSTYKAVFQVGHRNRYRHPKREVYERYGELGIERWRTDRDGALTIKFGTGITIDSYRRTRARYWHGR